MNAPWRSLRRGWVALVLLGWFSSGCSASNQQAHWAGDDYYRRGDYARAVVAYHVQLSEPVQRPDRSGAMLRLGLAYLTQSSAEADARAELILRQLIEQYPDSESAQSARIALTRLKRARRAEQAERDDSVRVARLEYVLGAYRRQLKRTRERLVAYREANTDASSERATMVKEIEGLKLKLKQQEAQIESLSKQLDAIKRIDLDRQPD
ncbi:MAG: hypothetical protein KC766_11045 [Myxococcales bacterium]|nr:hypothetical protein [Myxococcales bacterium]